MLGEKKPRTAGGPYRAGDADKWTAYNWGTNRISHFKRKSKGAAA